MQKMHIFKSKIKDGVNMKILMISEKDAANASLARIADAFLQQNDFVRVYATYYDPQVLQAFSDLIPRYPIHEIDEAAIEWCDIIFCSTLASIHLPEIVFRAHKPIFTHNYLMNRQINWGGDLCFAPSQATVASDYDEYLNYSYLGIGEPKYDEQERVSQTVNNRTEEKRFLFVDSGHFPFSLEGKKALAKTLLDICETYPDYELEIKPRFLPEDHIITHRNDIHLYDVIRKVADGKIPKNLKMLNKHEDLRTLIDRCSVMICLYTTAFVGAVVAGKGLIILENLPSEDVYDIRMKTYLRNRENMVASGALIDYRQVHKRLPDGVKADGGYLDFLLEEKDHVSDKIVEVCKYLWSNYYAKGTFPHMTDSVYQDYQNSYVQDPEMTWETVIQKRCHDYILLKSLILIDFHVKSKLDISCILESVKQYEDDFGLFLQNQTALRDLCIIKNADIMLKDRIDAGILLNAYYLTGQFDAIRQFPLKDLGAYHLYRAFVALEDPKESDQKLAKEHLETYCKISGERTYNLEISDMPNNHAKALALLSQL